MKIIFLDIDGVLNNIASHSCAATFNREYSLRLVPECLNNLNGFLKRTNARIVMSSSLRDGMTPQEWTQAFQKLGVTHAKVIGITPRLDRYENGIYIATTRGQEIEAWLHANSPNADYIIFDDDDDMGALKSNLFLVNRETGLTELDACEAAVRLNWWISSFEPKPGKQWIQCDGCEGDEGEWINGEFVLCKACDGDGGWWK